VYVQQGEAQGKVKPKRASLLKGMDGDTITLEQALGLLSLPRLVGIHPETEEPIYAGVGRFGPFVRMGAVYGSLDRDDDVMAVGINRAVDVLAKKLASVRQLGDHPKDKQPVLLRKGRFGPYAQHGQTVANIPRDAEFDSYTLDEAVALLAEKGKALKPRGGFKRAAKKASAAAPQSEAPARKAAKKAASRKTGAAKTARKTAKKAAPRRRTSG